MKKNLSKEMKTGCKKYITPKIITAKLLRNFFSTKAI